MATLGQVPHSGRAHGDMSAGLRKPGGHLIAPSSSAGVSGVLLL